jgi:hypothetical protein
MKETMIHNMGESQPAAKAYFEAQEIIFNDSESELSAYRLMLNAIYHVAVLGQPPSQETDQALTHTLSQGEMVTVPHQVLTVLNQRRLEMKQHSPWVEGHYRPGWKLNEEISEPVPTMPKNAHQTTKKRPSTAKWGKWSLAVLNQRKLDMKQ